MVCGMTFLGRRFFLQFFGIYFWGKESGSRVARMPTHAMKPHEWGTRQFFGIYLKIGLLSPSIRR
jgi:hypothetical protein